MIDPRSARIWAYRALFALVALAIVLLRLLPLDTVAGRGPGPDLMLCLAFAWLVRRPAYLPALLIVAVFLLADMLLQRPPGVHALTVLLGAEFLRGHVVTIRDRLFGHEWLLVAGTILCAALAERLLLLLVLGAAPDLGDVAQRTGLTILAYPAVVLFSNLVFRVTKVPAGEADTAGEQG